MVSLEKLISLITFGNVCLFKVQGRYHSRTVNQCVRFKCFKLKIQQVIQIDNVFFFNHHHIWKSQFSQIFVGSIVEVRNVIYFLFALAKMANVCLVSSTFATYGLFYVVKIITISRPSFLVVIFSFFKEYCFQLTRWMEWKCKTYCTPVLEAVIGSPIP